MNQEPSTDREEPRERGRARRILMPMVLVGIATLLFWLKDRQQSRSSSQRGSDATTQFATEGPGRPPGNTTPSPPSRRSLSSRPSNQLEPATAPRLSQTLSPDRNASHQPVPEETVFVRAAVDATANTLGMAGHIVGRVVLEGNPPPERPIPLDASCGNLRTDQPTTHFLVVGEQGGLGDVFVGIQAATNSPLAEFEGAVEPKLLQQVGCEFVPYVLAVQTNQLLLVRNSDPILHNVHVLPASHAIAEINHAQQPGDPALPLTFVEPELFLRIKCEVHPWMFAYVCVWPHSGFAVTDANGFFEIPNVPAGEYTLVAAHRKLKGLTQTVHVVPGRTNQVTFTFAITANAAL